MIFNSSSCQVPFDKPHPDPIVVTVEDLDGIIGHAMIEGAAVGVACDIQAQFASTPRSWKLRSPCAVLVLAAALVLAGCAPYASVSSVRPQFRPAGSTAGASAAEMEIIKALRQEKREPLVALGEFLAIAKSAQQQLARYPANVAVRSAAGGDNCQRERHPLLGCV